MLHFNAVTLSITFSRFVCFNKTYINDAAVVIGAYLHEFTVSISGQNCEYSESRYSY